MVRLLVVPVVVVAPIAQLATPVTVVPAAKETLVVTRSEAQPCCPVLVAVVAAKQQLVRTVHRPLVVQVVVDSLYQQVGLHHQHHHQDGPREAKRSLLVVVVVQTPQVAQVAHPPVVAMVVLDQPAQQPQQHQQLVPVVVVVV
jgi:hypothetical protein